MSDYLSNLVGRSLGRAEVVRPRPTGLFEPLPSTSQFAPEYHSKLEVLGEPQAYGTVTHGSPSTGLSRSRTSDTPRLSITAAQSHAEVRQRHAADLPGNSNRLSGQPISLKPPSSGHIAAQSSERRGEQSSRHSAPSPAESDQPAITLRVTETSSKEPVRRSAATQAESEPFQMATCKALQESAPDEYLLPPVVPLDRADKMSPGASAAQKNQSKLKTAIITDMSNRSDKSRSLPSHTSPFPEPRPIHTETIGPLYMPAHVTPHIEQTNKVTAEPTAKIREAPLIRVTIGRVEVRAMMAPPAPARAVRRPRPALSLEDYLKQSEGGKR